MRHLSIAFALLGLSLTSLPTSASAETFERPRITFSQKGDDLEIVVHNVSDYCATNADTRIVRTGDSIRIRRERPTRVSRCLDTRDLTFIVHDVAVGRYTITYERVPLVAPIRWMEVASSTAVIE